MKKTIKFILALLVGAVLVSCAQPQNGDTPPEENVFYMLYNNDKMMMYDLNDHLNNKECIFGYGLFSNITGDEKISGDVWKKNEDPIDTLNDFYFTSNKDCYALVEKEKGDANKTYTYFINIHKFSKENNGSYLKEVNTITLRENSENSREYSRIAVKDDNIYLSYLKNPSSLECNCSLIVYDSKTGELINDCIYDFEKEFITAIEVGENGIIYVASVDNGFKNYLTKLSHKNNTIEKIDKKEIELNMKTPYYQIMDLQLVGKKLYAIVANNATVGFGIDGASLYYGGGIISINADTLDFDSSKIAGYKSDIAEIKEDDLMTNWPYRPPVKDTNFFYLPKKFVAIKPKQLVIADDGFCSEDGTYEKSKGANSVVFMDIKNGIPEFSKRVVMKNISFTYHDTDLNSADDDIDFR